MRPPLCHAWSCRRLRSARRARSATRSSQERVVEMQVAADIRGVVSREMGEGGAELVGLCADIVYMGIGKLIGGSIKSS